MSDPYLPPEILDSIIDLLHDEPETLRQCCLVSKSWVPRARRHLFAYVKFRSSRDLWLWTETFPDVANSPAYHTHTLNVGCPLFVITSTSDPKVGSWIQAFSGIACLDVVNGIQNLNYWNSLAPFHKIAPALKSLRVGLLPLPHPELFDLICSLPLLEDLTLRGYSGRLRKIADPHGRRTVIPSTSPLLTGSLNLATHGGVGSVARQLLDLPNGLHFRKVTFSWDRKEDHQWITELVANCSPTLEYLDVRSRRRKSVRFSVRADSLTSFQVTSGSGSFNLSKAMKLRDVVFRPESNSVEWIIMALQTITSKHKDPRRISVYVPHRLTIFSAGADIMQHLGEASEEWLSLDRLLLQLLESRSVRLMVGCAKLGEEGQNTEYCFACLLPEITRRGIVDAV